MSFDFTDPLILGQVLLDTRRGPFSAPSKSVWARRTSILAPRRMLLKRKVSESRPGIGPMWLRQFFEISSGRDAALAPFGQVEGDGSPGWSRSMPNRHRGRRPIGFRRSGCRCCAGCCRRAGRLASYSAMVSRPRARIMSAIPCRFVDRYPFVHLQGDPNPVAIDLGEKHELDDSPLIDSRDQQQGGDAESQ